MAKWIKFEKGFLDSGSMTINDKVVFFIGRAGTWGISAEIDLYDRSLTLQILNLYIGFEVYHKPNEEA